MAVGTPSSPVSDPDTDRAFPLRGKGCIPSYTLPKRRRLLKSADFRLVGRCGEKRIGQYLIVEIITWRNPRRPTQLGLTVPKRFGDAVTRNRFKRVVREGFRLQQHRLPPAIGCVVSPRSEAKGASAAQIAQELCQLATRVG